MKPLLHRPSKVRCRLCSLTMYDCEPMGAPCFFHKNTGCKNSNKYLKKEDYKPWLPKSYRRARDRGARLAAKYRPR